MLLEILYLSNDINVLRRWHNPCPSFGAYQIKEKEKFESRRAKKIGDLISKSYEDTCPLIWEAAPSGWGWKN